MLISYGHLYEADLIHPLEASTMQECQKNILFDWLAKNVADIKNRVSSYAQAVARDFPVTKGTMPKLYSLYTIALQRLACEQEYPLFVHYGYDLTCQVTGSDENEYTIILNSECLEVLSDQELLALLGYQLGRIKAGHIQTLELISLMESGAKNLPVVGELVGKQLWAFFAEWMIVSQFTADRAALFACGSLKAVESLILKQMGSTPDKVEDLLQQKNKKPNNSLGIYYVWLSQSLPVFGGVERIKELRRWTSSQKFKEDYPMLFFNAAIDRGEKGDSATSRRLIDLHQRVYAGDVDAAVLLADSYLSGNSEMGNSMSAALWLYQQAAFGGSAKAMHVLATAMKSEIGGFKAQERTINRLYHCAASRGFSPSKRKLGANDVINADMPRIIQQRIHQYLPYCHCSVEYVFGTQNTSELDDVRNGFWMDGDDDIYALDITRSIEGNYLGVAISRKGIFGRVSDKDWPYGITWQELISSEFYQQELSQGNWLVSGTQPLYRVTNKLKGTIGELLVRLLGTKN